MQSDHICVLRPGLLLICVLVLLLYMCPRATTTYVFRPVAVELSPGVSSFCSLFHLQLLLHVCPRTTPVLLYICVLRPIAAELSPGVSSFCSLFHLQLLPHIFHPQLLLLIHLQLPLHMCPRTATVEVPTIYVSSDRLLSTHIWSYI
jgi:hypothetical protein